MAPQTSQTNKIGTRTGWQFECTKENGFPEDCGFLLRNHLLPQLVQFARTHVKDSHQVDVPDTYVESVSKKVTF